jgi:L-serine dehydratase
MAISVFELFKIGIGPSSSHTVGPMRAALKFAKNLQDTKQLEQTDTIKVEFFGSLGATGIGHGSDRAVILGLEGETPELINPEAIDERIDKIRTTQKLCLLGKKAIAFCEKEHLLFHWHALPFHPNGMLFSAYNIAQEKIASQIYYSVGGGFVVEEEEIKNPSIQPDVSLPYSFKSATQLLELCEQHGLSISQLMLENEKYWRSEEEVRQGLWHIWEVMQACVCNGFKNEGILPGGLQVKRRAPELYRQLSAKPDSSLTDDPLAIIDWVNLYAIAVNEENAAGGRVVTAPTNGAAGIIPAILHYYNRFCPSATRNSTIDFLLTAGAIGILYKENASISGADVGCQGEVGVASSMAAGALTEVLGGTPKQVENAAEIAMEHHLGLTCDPVGGLVQIPCIERNAMGAVKAINASRIALQGDGKHVVSLDKAIATMRVTGADMPSQYKETARGGLAVNVVEC